METSIYGVPHPDLPVWSYTEQDEVNKLGKANHVCRIKVFQFDRIVEYIQYTGKPNQVGFIIPGGVTLPNGKHESLQTVREFQDIADAYKLTKAGVNWLEVSDDEFSRRKAAAKGRVVYGRSARR